MGDVSLKGKVAVITGSTKGIGNGIAFEMAAAGADIVVVSRNQADCDRVADEIKDTGVEALPVAADVTRLDSVNNLTERVLDVFGRIDILVNNAGSAITRKAEDITEEEWDRVLNVDLKGVFFCCQTAGRQMIRRNCGKIINIASILGLVGDRMVLPYCVAKGGVIQMTRALALEWARYNIQVNALCPGYMITPMNQEDMKNDKIYNHIIKKTPMRRFGEIQDIVGAAVFLASGASDFMTGQTLVIDGGWTAE